MDRTFTESTHTIGVSGDSRWTDMSNGASGRSGLMLPGGAQLVELKCAIHPGLNAFPTSMAAQSPDGVVQHIFGGLTKLEYAALAIASGQGIAVEQAVDKAQQILEECARRQAVLAPITPRE